MRETLQFCGEMHSRRFVARVTDAFPRRRENVHALGAKCRRRWHARSWCFPARKEMSSNKLGSGENGTMLRYIVARNTVMLRYLRTILTSATPHNWFKRWIDYLSVRCFRKILHTCNTVSRNFVVYNIAYIFNFNNNFKFLQLCKCKYLIYYKYVITYMYYLNIISQEKSDTCDFNWKF